MSAALKSLVDLRTTAYTDKTSNVGWVESLRDDALAIFLESGLPTRKLEDWKGTNFAPLGAMQFTRVGPADTTDSTTDDTANNDAVATGTDDAELIFVDGRFDATASRSSALPDGVRALSLAEVLENEPELLQGRLGQLPDLKRQSLVALQTAFLADGAVLVLDAGARTTQPLRIRFISTAATEASAAFPRLLVLAGEGSHATLVQEHLTVGRANSLHERTRPPRTKRAVPLPCVQPGERTGPERARSLHDRTGR